MPDPNRKVVRDPVKYPARPLPSEEAKERFIELPVCTECICSGYCFKELIEIAKAEDLTYEQVLTLTGAGSDCEVCVPYAKVAIETGNPEVVIDPSATQMWIHHDGILEKEPPKLKKQLLDPVAIAREQKKLEIASAGDTSIKTEIE